MNSSLSAFAEDPAAHLPAPAGAIVVDETRFHLSVSTEGRRAGVCRLRLGAADVGDVFAEIRRRAPRARTEWIVGPSSTPDGLEDQLRTLGARDQDPPLTSRVAALATDVAPPRADAVAVRRVETYDDFLVGLEVSVAGWELSEADAERERGWAAETWERRRIRPGGEWIASIDGEPVAYAGAIAGPVGLFLTGGVTLPQARGRGAYRALVRARWDEAVGRGTPALVVHAEEASRRVLEAIGFERVCEIVELVTDARA
jgi:GNAT superfamily N-acetyltransferase